jgi:galactokinase
MSFEGISTLDAISNLKIKFEQLFGNSEKSKIVVVPGSIILLGDHNHYNQGILISAAVNKYRIIQIKKRDDKIVNIASVDSTGQNIKKFSLLDIESVEGENYPVLTGLTKILREEKLITSGFDCLIYSSIPECLGIGSISALEMGFVAGIKKIFKLPTDTSEIFNIIRKNELKLLGKISNKAHFHNLKYAKEEKLLLVDLRTLEHKHIPLNGNAFNIVVCDIGEKIINPQEICNERISECEVGVKGLRLYIWGIKNLRDVELDFLLKHFHMLPKKIFSRVLYNVKERMRTESAVKALKSKSIKEFGKIITESHWSLVNEYELSCEKCDFLVEESCKIEGVHGSKMISCSPIRSTFHIVEKIHTRNFVEAIKNNYRDKYNEELTTHILSLKGGLKELTQKEIQFGSF